MLDNGIRVEEVVRHCHLYTWWDVLSPWKVHYNEFEFISKFSWRHISSLALWSSWALYFVDSSHPQVVDYVMIDSLLSFVFMFLGFLCLCFWVSERRRCSNWTDQQTQKWPPLVSYHLEFACLSLVYSYGISGHSLNARSCSDSSPSHLINSLSLSLFSDIYFLNFLLVYFSFNSFNSFLLYWAIVSYEEHDSFSIMWCYFLTF